MLRKGTAWTWTAKDSSTSDRTRSGNTIRRRARSSLKYRIRLKRRTDSRSLHQRSRFVLPVRAPLVLWPDSLRCRDKLVAAVAAKDAAVVGIPKQQPKQPHNRQRSE